MERLRQRKDFLAAANAPSVSTAGFVVQQRWRDDRGAVRVGFTVSKKVGRAVERNRVRRQLREIVRLSAATALRDGNDYVVIGRKAALAIPFSRLAADFSLALNRLEKGRRVAPRTEREAQSSASRQTSSGDQSRS